MRHSPHSPPWWWKQHWHQANVKNYRQYHCTGSGIIFLDFDNRLCTHFYTLHLHWKLQKKKSNILSFQFATTHWHSSIRDVELEMWVSPLSSHLNEPWGMRTTPHFGCALPTMCKADTVSASLPKGILILHAFTFDQCKFDSTPLAFFQGWVLYLQTGIKFTAQSELIVLVLFSHLILPIVIHVCPYDHKYDNYVLKPPLVHKVRHEHFCTRDGLFSLDPPHLITLTFNHFFLPLLI